jgi:hypothetical protein
MFTAIAKIIDHAAEPRMYAAAPYPPRHPHAVRCSRRDGAYDGGLGGLPKSAQMASRTLDALRAATGADAGPELAVAVVGMPFDRLDELAETIVAESAHPTLTAPARTQVWPVVTIRASTFASGGVCTGIRPDRPGLNLNAALNPRFAGTGHFSDGVLRALLYCHGLVIEDTRSPQPPRCI